MRNTTRFQLDDTTAGVAASELPSMVRVRQTWPRPVEADVPAAVHRELASVLDDTVAGKRIAVTGSSRGIVGFDVVARECVAALKARGAVPFVVPGMGSHGGATAPGQIGVLKDINNVTEETVGCPIEASMDVVQVGTTATGFPVYQDRLAHEADGVFLINRVKPHTSFTERVESGLCKMMVIGLGKQAGASRIHQQARHHGMGRLILDATRIIVESERPRIIGGVALVENAFKETAHVRATRVRSFDEIVDFEAELLKEAWRLLPTLPFDDIDALIVDEIGKNISGAGMDTNVIGKKEGMTRPNIGAIYVRGLTDETHGNAIGIGFADVIPRDLVEQIDLNATYMNAFTAKRANGVKIPMAVENDLQALQFLMNFRAENDPHSLRMAWIQNTSALNELRVTEALARELAERENIEIVSDPVPLTIDTNGGINNP